jgi:hypothetical protein
MESPTGHWLPVVCCRADSVAWPSRRRRTVLGSCGDSAAPQECSDGPRCIPDLGRAGWSRSRRPGLPVARRPEASILGAIDNEMVSATHRASSCGGRSHKPHEAFTVRSPPLPVPLEGAHAEDRVGGVGLGAARGTVAPRPVTRRATTPLSNRSFQTSCPELAAGLAERRVLRTDELHGPFDGQLHRVVVDSLLLSMALRFAGTPDSTYSTGIWHRRARERAERGERAEEAWTLDGRQPNGAASRGECWQRCATFAALSA